MGRADGESGGKSGGDGFCERLIVPAEARFFSLRTPARARAETGDMLFFSSSSGSLVLRRRLNFKSALSKASTVASVEVA